MNKEQIQELMMGAAIVALAYALWQHFKKAPNGTAGLPATGSGAALNTGVPFDTANPGQLIRLSDLLAGTVHDIATGDTAGESTATVGEINQSVLDEAYGIDSTATSVVKQPGAYW